MSRISILYPDLIDLEKLKQFGAILTNPYKTTPSSMACSLQEVTADDGTLMGKIFVTRWTLFSTCQLKQGGGNKIQHKIQSPKLAGD